MLSCHDRAPSCEWDSRRNMPPLGSDRKLQTVRIVYRSNLCISCGQQLIWSTGQTIACLDDATAREPRGQDQWPGLASSNETFVGFFPNKLAEPVVDRRCSVLQPEMRASVDSEVSVVTSLISRVFTGSAFWSYNDKILLCTFARRHKCARMWVYLRSYCAHKKRTWPKC
jgi:hypothetical protein